jgi:hypothetical protein
MIRTDASFAAFANSLVESPFLPEISGIGHGDVAPENVGGRPEDGMVHWIGRDLKGKVLSLDGLYKYHRCHKIYTIILKQNIL